MKYKIGVFGSASGELKSDVIEKAKELGRILSEKNVIIINGACAGLPYEVAYEAAKKGTDVIGYSQATDIKTQEELVKNYSSLIYKKIVYIPKDYKFASSHEVCKKYRNVRSTADCDAGIIISGRWGTMNEFTNLYDMGKVIGVLTETGGIADELENLSKKISKESKAKIIFSSSPVALVNNIINELNQRRVKG